MNLFFLPFSVGTGWQPPVPFFIRCEITPASKKQKKFIKIIDNIKIDFSIIAFFNTDYGLDWFFSNNRFRFRLKSIVEFSKIDITSHIKIAKFVDQERLKNFHHPLKCFGKVVQSRLLLRNLPKSFLGSPKSGANSFFLHFIFEIDCSWNTCN